jgi:hypothetical protein
MEMKCIVHVYDTTIQVGRNSIMIGNEQGTSHRIGL